MTIYVVKEYQSSDEYTIGYYQSFESAKRAALAHISTDDGWEIVDSLRYLFMAENRETSDVIHIYDVEVNP